MLIRIIDITTNNGNTMTLIRVQVKDGKEPYNQKQGVINPSQVVMYEESNELWWATQELYNKDMEKGVCNYEHAKTSTRVFLTSGQVIIVCESFKSFDRTFTSMTSR